MEFFADYASFLAKTVTLVIAIVVVLVVIAALRGKGRRRSAGQLQVNKMNEFYKGLRDTLEQSLLPKDQLKSLRKQQAKTDKKLKKLGCSCWISTVISRLRPLKACVTKSLLCWPWLPLPMRWYCVWKVVVAWFTATAWRRRNWRVFVRRGFR